jgi:hypothetical protein
MYSWFASRDNELGRPWKRADHVSSTSKKAEPFRSERSR